MKVALGLIVFYSCRKRTSSLELIYLRCMRRMEQLYKVYFWMVSLVGDELGEVVEKSSLLHTHPTSQDPYFLHGLARLAMDALSCEIQ
mmetsp:Transcript_9429/g.13765  ORF Transcript_9429/g.13765 Transcript_9429/m.13765 type:complete len:88 (+) Transcript_9429:55-318(+)